MLRMSAQQDTNPEVTMNTKPAAIETVKVGQRIVSRKHGVMRVTRSAVARNPRDGRIDPERWALQVRDERGETRLVKAAMGFQVRAI